METITGNPEIPVKAVQEQMQKKFSLGISRMKAFRAKSQASTKIKGDYRLHYSLLRDYVLELKKCNPDTTVKIEVQPPTYAESNTRIFKRIYVSLGALKLGFKAGLRDILGLDGAFMKGPFPGQVLTTVSVDANNGIYPLAYAIVEAETTKSWTWFLQCLGSDLDLGMMSNFTFVTDRQKGVIPAISKLFPCSEHRFCLRHIHENMNNTWKGVAYKNMLWRCATSTTIVEFNKCMDDLKKFNAQAYEWLKKIPAEHWSGLTFQVDRNVISC